MSVLYYVNLEQLYLKDILYDNYLFILSYTLDFSNVIRRKINEKVGCK
jgi:hypothetical protein